MTATAPRSRSILITGAASGIGYAATSIMAARGWTVFAGVRQAADVARFEGMAGVRALALDYADAPSLRAAVATVLGETGGRLDALYQNGATAVPGALEDIPTDALRLLFEVNVFGWHELGRLVIPAMRAQGHGRIVFCSSVLGFMSMPHRGAYAASKYAVEAFADTLRLELRDGGIAVSTIEPGPIRTRFVEKSMGHFDATVDVDASAFRDDYRRRRADAGGPPSPLSKPPEAVVDCLIHACEARRPRPVYRVTSLTRGAALAKRLLPVRAFDALARFAAARE
jgi:NAD(P)-dependent dehydrogenase (short-subunit alcohol dehydrogenase family)